MKKLRWLFVVIVALVVSMAFCACGGSSVEGKKYVYDSLEISWSESATDVQKNAIVGMIQLANPSEEINKNNVLEKMNELMEEQMGDAQASIEFKAEGKAVTNPGNMEVTWTQDGETVTVGEMKMTVSGKKLTVSMSDMTEGADEFAGVDVTVVYKRA